MRYFSWFILITLLACSPAPLSSANQSHELTNATFLQVPLSCMDLTAVERSHYENDWSGYRTYDYWWKLNQTGDTIEWRHYRTLQMHSFERSYALVRQDTRFDIEFTSQSNSGACDTVIPSEDVESFITAVRCLDGSLAYYTNTTNSISGVCIADILAQVSLSVGNSSTIGKKYCPYTAYCGEYGRYGGNR